MTKKNLPTTFAQTLAAQWRGDQCAAESPLAQSGVVLIWQDAVYGWKNELRNPEDERPGAIAVDVEGNEYIALGGNERMGAQRWVAHSPELKALLEVIDNSFSSTLV